MLQRDEPSLLWDENSSARSHVMNCRTLIVLATGGVCGLALWMSFYSPKVSAQNNGSAPSGPVYNPYPPGILPSDLSSEIARVLREVDFVESRAITRWHNLKPPILTGQPPVLQNTGTESTETLGELMLFDKNISPNRNQACTSCHMPYVGFSGPIPSVNLTMVAFPGTVHFRAGKRTAQRHPYSPFFPVLQYNQVQGLFFGGNFFDSRATGYLLRIPDAEQAQSPPVDTLEMGFPDTACIAFRLSHAVYRPLFEEVWGKGSFDINFPHETARICATPGGAAVFGGSTTPIPLSASDRTRANTVYDHWAQSVDSYEQSVQVSAFSSKFDAFLAGKYKLTADEMAGFKLFDGKGYRNSLKQVVHFYNTRDKYAYPVTSGHCPAGTIEKVDCWPMPEVRNNIDMTTGNLGLTDEEENQIVKFLQTLTDGFTRPYRNRDTFTGACMKGGSAATQGNEFLIPTPPLPSCASAICGVEPVPNPPIP